MCADLHEIYDKEIPTKCTETLEIHFRVMLSLIAERGNAYIMS